MRCCLLWGSLSIAQTACSADHTALREREASLFRDLIRRELTVQDKYADYNGQAQDGSEKPQKLCHDINIGMIDDQENDLADNTDDLHNEQDPFGNPDPEIAGADITIGQFFT